VSGSRWPIPKGTSSTCSDGSHGLFGCRCFRVSDFELRVSGFGLRGAGCGYRGADSAAGGRGLGPVDLRPVDLGPVGLGPVAQLPYCGRSFCREGMYAGRCGRRTQVGGDRRRHAAASGGVAREAGTQGAHAGQVMLELVGSERLHGDAHRGPYGGGVRRDRGRAPGVDTSRVQARGAEGGGLFPAVGRGRMRAAVGRTVMRPAARLDCAPTHRAGQLVDGHLDPGAG